MGFLTRGLVGLALIALMAVSVGYGVYRVAEAVTTKEEARGAPARERSYAVNVAPLQAQTVRPVTTAYGEIETWRALQIRASSEGRIVDIAGKFRDGAAVEQGDLLLRIDPAVAEFAVLDAEAALADAESQKAEAEEAIVGAEQELVAARRQLELRRQALNRQTQLLEKGYATMVQVESEELSVAALEQALNNRLQSVITARKRIERMDLGVERARIARDEARRILAETTIEAPFDGYLDQVDATLGRRATPSEALAYLIDPAALEVRFNLSTDQYARLLDPSGQLVEAPVSVFLELGPRTIEVGGQIDRVAATVMDGGAGRTVFASLDVDTGTVLRPGDFVTIRIEEPALTGVADIPATAVTEDGSILVVNADSRLDEDTVTILRRMGSRLIVSDAPFGADIVLERLPHLGPGLKVTSNPVNGEGRLHDGGGLPTARPEAGTDGGKQAGMVALGPDRRKALRDALQASPLDAAAKTEILDLLDAPMMSVESLARIEAQIGQRG
ncbi:hypothetical protein GCM10011316_04150 [Roseibium aquae]|uniref:Multidrug resistance protein MdtA-like barrel-sandwich hybrid domain-containing protein n=1 Tax=Roseibium aquae TaxID=1323746 RepID=A0A916T8Y9_9HYPH|nr:HlyD family efflux transporter periplasmic adaptor subunit [Roseibium aquae]GGB35190.1 hypothetical protein GCM10011316_04150 [Roseibium aquae]